MSDTETTRAVVSAYHAGWSTGRFAEAFERLADPLAVEVPINAYTGKADFADAVARFAGAATHVDLIAEFADGSQAMLLYDIALPGLPALRVAEHFTVRDGRIVRIRQIHDTAPFRG